MQAKNLRKNVDVETEWNLKIKNSHSFSFLVNVDVETEWNLNWDQVLNQMIVLYGDRLTQYL